MTSLQCRKDRKWNENGSVYGYGIHIYCAASTGTLGWSDLTRINVERHLIPMVDIYTSEDAGASEKFWKDWNENAKIVWKPWNWQYQWLHLQRKPTHQIHGPVSHERQPFWHVALFRDQADVIVTWKIMDCYSAVATYTIGPNRNTSQTRPSTIGIINYIKIDLSKTLVWALVPFGSSTTDFKMVSESLDSSRTVILSLRSYWVRSAPFP